MSRITHRKGLSENLPQLAGAEFGWVLDERRLFIGNGTLVDGAPVIGNTEILTEFSDILALSSTYTYKGEAAGYVVGTGENEEAIVRSLQGKFDDIASVKDFGAVGDGETDDTDAINRALYELFCRESNVEVRRSLFFPAGTYKVSETIKVPPHARLWGEGLTSSIIKFVSADDVLITDIVPGTRYAISAINGSDFTSIGAASNTVDIVFTATAAGVGAGLVRGVTEQVVETSDSLQQTGANIGNNGAEAPTGIELTSMAIYSTEENTLLKLDSVTNSGFNYLGLHGPNTDATSLGYRTSAVEIASSVAPTNDVTMTKLDTHGTTYGLRVAGEARGVVLENSGLDFHYQGVHIHNDLIQATALELNGRYKIIEIGTTDFTPAATFNRRGETFTASGPLTGTGTVVSMDDPGPTGVVVSRNIFDNIAFEGIHFHNTLFNSSGYNVFYNVGNNLGAVAVSPVIRFDTDQCTSVGDLFSREDESTFSRISLAGNGGIAIDGTHSIHLGSYERQIGIECEVPDNITVPKSIFVMNDTDVNSYKVDYNIKRSVGLNFETRMGTICVSNDGSAVLYNDEYTESGDTGVVLSVTSPGADTSSEFQFTTTAGETAILNYSIEKFV